MSVLVGKHALTSEVVNFLLRENILDLYVRNLDNHWFNHVDEGTLVDSLDYFEWSAVDDGQDWSGLQSLFRLQPVQSYQPKRKLI